MCICFVASKGYKLILSIFILLLKSFYLGAPSELCPFGSCILLTCPHPLCSEHFLTPWNSEMLPAHVEILLL